VAVAHHDAAGVERGQNDALHVVAAVGGEEEGHHRLVGLDGPPCPVGETPLEDLADDHAHRAARRLGGEDDLAALPLEPRGEQARLGRRARAVNAFQDDEQAVGHPAS